MKHIRKEIKRLLEHSTYLLILIILIPAFLYFELCIVLPAVVKAWSIAYLIHYFCSIFLIFNIISNMIYGMFTNTSIKGKNLESLRKSNWTFCSVCECFCPPRAWHCNNCDICILKRDHHCTFFACCVGYFNHRYFMYFTLYIFISMMYSFYYNVIFLSKFTKWNGGLLILKCVFPFAGFVIDFGTESLYIFMADLSFIIGLLTGFLFLYHFDNLLKGIITPEKKNANKDNSYNKGWKMNLVEVFGSRWYLTWISPFINSPLPGNGITWYTKYKSK